MRGASKQAELPTRGASKQAELPMRGASKQVEGPGAEGLASRRSCGREGLASRWSCGRLGLASRWRGQEPRGQRKLPCKSQTKAFPQIIFLNGSIVIDTKMHFSWRV